MPCPSNHLRSFLARGEDARDVPPPLPLAYRGAVHPMPRRGVTGDALAVRFPSKRRNVDVVWWEG